MPTEKTSDKHPYLYHYTTYCGFRGIIETQTLWAKYFRHLNDTSEVHHISPKLRDLIVPRIKEEIKRYRRELEKESRVELERLIEEKGGIDNLTWQQADLATKTFSKITFGSDTRPPMFPPYVVSFCSHIDDTSGYTGKNGLLSMWNGYGGDGGVALVFDTEGLEECLKREAEEYHYNPGCLGEVVYEGDDTSFNEEFGPFIEMLKNKAIAFLTRDESFLKPDKFIEGYLRTAPRYKHRAFAEEREVRIVASPWTDEHFVIEDDEEQIRPKKKKMPVVRYGSEYIDLFDGTGVGRLPIQRVIIGPSRYQADRRREVKAALKSHPEIKICCSKTPYIGR